MILIGDKLIPYETCFFIDSLFDIEKTKPNSTLIFKFDENILLFCKKNALNCAVIAENIKEAIYCNALKSKYIICNKTLAKTIQTIAENYMFDSRILSIIENCNEIEEVALSSVDGVIYSSLLKK